LSKARTTARAREREVYKSAQFIEDSDEEYGQDIDAFFVREAELRERTALAAVDSALGTGTMRASGTKKRRRPRGRATTTGDPDPDDGGDGGTRQTKRRAVLAPRGDSAQSESESAEEQQQQQQEAPRPPKPKPRPRYQGRVTTTIGVSPTQQQDGETAFLAPGDEDVSSHVVGDQDRNVSDAEDDNDVGDDEIARGGGVGANGSGPRKGRVIISDEE